MSRDNELIPISALQHWLFCRRQCALIHVEGSWEENRFTAEGRVLHAAVHAEPSETRDGVRLARGLRLASTVLGVSGIADLVELHPPKDADGVHWRDAVASAVDRNPEMLRRWRVVPVETKRGRGKTDDRDRIQVAAQAMCLEDMLGIRVPQGAIFYGQPRRRERVRVDAALRQVVRQAVVEVRATLLSGRTPPPEPGPKCRTCSLRSHCLPDVAGDAGRWLDSRFDALLKEEE